VWLPIRRLDDEGWEHLSWLIGLIQGLMDEARGHPVTATVVLLTALAQGFIVYPLAVADAEAIILHATQEVQQNAVIAGISEEVADVKDEVSKLTESSIRRELSNARQQQCKAASPEARQYFQQQMDVLKEDYYKMNGHAYSEPSCEIFGGQ